MYNTNKDNAMLHGNGGTMPALGLGTWRLSGEECTQTVLKALELGYRHIDTAQMYGNEHEIGNALQESEVDRDEIFLTTKVWIDSLDRESLLKTTKESLGKLQTEYVDLLLIHWPMQNVPLEKTLGAMEDLQTREKVRHIGVSNFTVAWMKKAQETCQAPIFCNQVEYHPYLSQKPVLKHCRDNDILLVAYSPLARGKILGDKTLRRIGQKYDKTPAQIALRWLLQQKGVGAIPKASSAEHLKDNIDIREFRLTEGEMGEIFHLNCGRRLVNPDGMPMPEWDT